MKGRLNGQSIAAPSLEGDSGFAELGLSIQPENSPLSLDVSVYGNFGQREGFGGSLSLGWNF